MGEGIIEGALKGSRGRGGAKRHDRPLIQTFERGECKLLCGFGLDWDLPVCRGHVEGSEVA